MYEIQTGKVAWTIKLGLCKSIKKTPSIHRQQKSFLARPGLRLFRCKQLNAIKFFKHALVFKKDASSLLFENEYVPDTIFDNENYSVEFMSSTSDRSSAAKSFHRSTVTGSDNQLFCQNSYASSKYSELQKLSSSRTISDSTNQISDFCLNNFENFQVLGAGGMGTVYSATLECYETSIPGLIVKKEYAIKQIEQNNDDDYGNDNEAAVLQLVSDNENIVSYYGLIVESQCKFIVMEKLQGPSLFGLLRQGYVMSERTALKIAQDAYTALAYIHDRGVAHLDIKPENIVFISEIPEGEDDLPPTKLIDFGLSVPCESDLSDIRGTPGYIAPEILCAKRVPSYAPADIWSTGVLLYEMLTGRLPFREGVSRKIMETGKVPELTLDSADEFSLVSKETKKFLLSCLQANPADRPSAKCALEEVTFRLWMLD